MNPHIDLNEYITNFSGTLQDFIKRNLDKYAQTAQSKIRLIHSLEEETKKQEDIPLQP